MKSIQAVALILACCIATSSSYAALVEVTRPGRRAGLFFLESSFGLRSALVTSTDSFRTSFDTVADTGTIVDAQFSLEATDATRVSTHTYEVGPPDFPLPPPTVTLTVSESLEIDPIAAAVDFISSPTAPIIHVSGDTFRMSSLTTVAFPASFTLSGVYRAETATDSVTAPFSIVFNRVLPNTNLSALVMMTIDTGASFPDSAQIAGGSFDRMTYRPTTQFLFQGDLDGIDFAVHLNNVDVFAFPLLPEPSSAVLLALAMGGLTRIRRRS